MNDEPVDDESPEGRTDESVESELVENESVDLVLARAREVGIREEAIIAALHELIAEGNTQPPTGIAIVDPEAAVAAVVTGELSIATLVMNILDELDASSGERFRWIQRLQQDWLVLTTWRAQWLGKIKEVIRRL